MKRVLVAFDLDHTLINENSDTYILRLLPDGSQLPPSIKKLYSSDGWNDYMREVFRYLHSCHVTKDQLLSCVAEIPLVEGMRELLEYLNLSTMMAAKTAESTESSVHKVDKDAAMLGGTDAKVAKNDVFLMQQQQHSVTSDAGTMSLTAKSEFSDVTVSPSAIGPHSAVDGENPSDFPVQFDVIIVSDSNSVSTSQSVCNLYIGVSYCNAFESFVNH